MTELYNKQSYKSSYEKWWRHSDSVSLESNRTLLQDLPRYKEHHQVYNSFPDLSLTSGWSISN